MNRLVFLILISFVSLVPAFAAEDYAGVEIKLQPLAGSVYMLEGAGGNIGLSAGEDGILMVDDQFAPLSSKIEAALKEVNPGGLKFVLNTHYHPDHTGGNEHFGKTAAIIAHENVRKRLSADQVSKFFDRTRPAIAEEGWPVITFDKSVTIHFNDEDIEVAHFPAGHTDGDSIIFFTRANVVHMGDHFFNGRFPFVDFESGGSVEGMIRNVKKVLERVDENTAIIPGHGAVAKRADLEAFVAMLEETSWLIKKELKQGTSPAGIAAGSLAPWSEWGGGFISAERWVQIVQNESA